MTEHGVRGGLPASPPYDVAQAVDVLITSLPTAEALDPVCQRGLESDGAPDC